MTTLSINGRSVQADTFEEAVALMCERYPSILDALSRAMCGEPAAAFPQRDTPAATESFVPLHEDNMSRTSGTDQLATGEIVQCGK